MWIYGGTESIWLAMLELISTTGLHRGIMDSQALPFITLLRSIIATRCAVPAAFSGSTGRKPRDDRSASTVAQVPTVLKASMMVTERFGVKHRRAVQWLGGAGWVIVDDIEGSGRT